MQSNDFSKPLRDADAQSDGRGTGFQLVWLVLRGTQDVRAPVPEYQPFV